jgi:hypothetical protein
LPICCASDHYYGGVMSVVGLVLVIALFVFIVGRMRANIHDRNAVTVSLPRQEVRRRLESIPRSRIRQETTVMYRWKPLDTSTANDRMPAKLVLTDSELILLPSAWNMLILGLGLFLPGYWIPLRSIRSVSVADEPKLPLVYSPFAAKWGQLVAVAIESGATCWIRFKYVSDAEPLLQARH